MKKQLLSLGVIGAAVAAVSLTSVVSAASTVVVTPVNTQGWSTADTRPGGAVNYVLDADAPAGVGALQLTTTASGAAKAQYLKATQTPIADVTELSYYTKQNSASFNDGAPSYQLPVCLLGLTAEVTELNPTGCAGFTTFVYEPYQNGGTVTANLWQSWDVDAGQLWSSRSVTCANGSVAAGGGGAPFYTLDQISTSCPNAVVAGFGVNVGSNNPSYDVLTDLVSFNDVAYDFEPALSPQSKEACKDGGWQDFNAPVFKNQGDCVSHVASKGRSSN